MSNNYLCVVAFEKFSQIMYMKLEVTKNSSYKIYKHVLVMDNFHLQTIEEKDILQLTWNNSTTTISLTKLSNHHSNGI